MPPSLTATSRTPCVPQAPLWGSSLDAPAHSGPQVAWSPCHRTSGHWLILIGVETGRVRHLAEQMCSENPKHSGSAPTGTLTSSLCSCQHSFR